MSQLPILWKLLYLLYFNLSVKDLVGSLICKLWPQVLHVHDSCCRWVFCSLSPPQPPSNLLLNTAQLNFFPFHHLPRRYYDLYIFLISSLHFFAKCSTSTIIFFSNTCVFVVFVHQWADNIIIFEVKEMRTRRESILCVLKHTVWSPNWVTFQKRLIRC